MRPIEDIISEKAYSELSEMELMEVSEMAANEEEYNQMKRFFDSFTEEVHAEYRFEASPSVKSSLDSIYAAKHPVIAQDWKKEEALANNTPVIPLYKRRSLQIAAVLLLCLGSAPLFFRQENEVLSADKTDSSAVASVGAKNKTSVSEDSKGIPQKENTPNELPPVLTARVDEIELVNSKEKIDSDLPTMTYSFSSPMNEPKVSAATISDGLRADLDPSLSSTQGGMTNYRSSTAEASGSEMLDWIQAAY